MFGWEDFGEIEKRSGKYGRKQVEKVLGRKREGERKMLGPAILSLGPPKFLLSPNQGENEGEKGIVCFGLNCHFSVTFCFLGFFGFLVSFIHIVSWFWLMLFYFLFFIFLGADLPFFLFLLFGFICFFHSHSFFFFLLIYFGSFWLVLFKNKN